MKVIMNRSMSSFIDHRLTTCQYLSERLKDSRVVTYIFATIKSD